MGRVPQRHRNHNRGQLTTGTAVTILRYMLRALGWGVAGLLIGAFCIGYVAPYLPPSHFWWANLLAVLLPPLGLAVGLLGLGLLGHGVYRRAWGRVVIAGALLALLALRFAPRGRGWSASAADVETVRLMTFNVPMSFARQDASARALEQFVQREAPDVLALQESWVTTEPAPASGRGSRPWPPRAFLEDALGYTLPRARPARTTLCQPVLGRLALDSLSVHPLPPGGDTSRCSRYTRTRFAWQDRPAVLYNLHLHTIGSVRPWEVMEDWGSLDRWRAFLRSYRIATLRRAEQARLIRRRIEQETHPVLVVGDFNSTPHQWAYRHIAQGLQRADSQGRWGRGATFPARRPLVRIDHVLAGPAWDVVATGIPVPEGDTAISDHRSVFARLRWERD